MAKCTGTKVIPEEKAQLAHLLHLLVTFIVENCDLVALAHKILLKRWKKKLLAFAFLIPVVYLLSISRYTVKVSQMKAKGQNPISLHVSADSKDDVFKTSTEKKNVSGPCSNKLLSQMIKVDWIKMEEGGEDLYTFISAYYDGRSEVPGRPSITVLAYVQEHVYKPRLRCILKYSNGSISCPGSIIAKQELVNVFSPVYVHRKYDFKLIVCPLQDDTDVPQMIQFSSTTSCEKESMSAEIHVRNRKVSTTLPSKGIGVCLQGSLQPYQGMGEDIKNFLSMCKFLGADFVTIYASSEEVDHKILKQLLTDYPTFVNLVEWKVLQYDYHGQFGIIHDCLYRHMYETKYLAFIDLDEMILPMKHDNWLHMLDELEMRVEKNSPGYSFLNRLYTPSNQTYLKQLHTCDKVDKNATYLTWFNERKCIYKYNHRSKMILKPLTIVNTLIHRIGKVVENKELLFVDRSFAITAHYRRRYTITCWNIFTRNMFNQVQTLITKYINFLCK